MALGDPDTGRTVLLGPFRTTGDSYSPSEGGRPVRVRPSTPLLGKFSSN